MTDQTALPGQTAAAYVEKKWGGASRTVPFVNVSIFTTWSRILLNNPRRMFWFMTNIGSSNVYFWRDGSPSSATLAILLPPLGGSASMAIDEDGELVGEEVWAIAASGTPFVSGFEVMTK